MGKKKQKLFTYVEVDDRMPIQKLSIKDQIRVMIKNATKDDANELKADDASTIYALQLKADLLEFIHKSTEPIRNGKHSAVTMLVSNKFDPILYEVLDSPAVTSFYNVSVSSPEIDYDIPYMNEITLEVKTN